MEILLCRRKPSKMQQNNMKQSINLIIILALIGCQTKTTNMNTQNDTQQITQLINKLYVYTDEQEWDKLHNEVFTHDVWLDMESLGGPKQTMKATEITGMWAQAYTEIDAVNHLAGNYIINIDGDQGDVYAYATATQYKKDATQGTTRDFVGTYNFKVEKKQGEWRLNFFQYNLKYMTGNIELK